MWLISPKIKMKNGGSIRLLLFLLSTLATAAVLGDATTRNIDPTGRETPSSHSTESTTPIPRAAPEARRLPAPATPIPSSPASRSTPTRPEDEPYERVQPEVPLNPAVTEESSEVEAKRLNNVLLEPPRNQGISIKGNTSLLGESLTTSGSDLPKTEVLYKSGQVLLFSKSMADAKIQENLIRSFGFRIIRRVNLEHLRKVITIFRLPPNVSVPEGLGIMENAMPDSVFDANHYYRLLDSTDNVKFYAPQMINWTSNHRKCGRSVAIGLIDSGVNSHHKYLKGAKITEKNFGVKSNHIDDKHGTAIASLLIANEKSVYPGLLPQATLYSARVFSTGETAPTSDTFQLLAAINWLISQNIKAINMSFGGPKNQLLQSAVNVISQKKILMIAAAGNGGRRAPPVFPAAYESVIAVTAIDMGKSLYRKAQQGRYVDVASPGVDVWAANSLSSGYFATGTSFAVPFALAALVVNDQINSADTARIYIADHSEDLGGAGKDSLYGWGLLSAGPCQ